MTDPDDPAGALISSKTKYVVTSSPVGDVWADATTVLGKEFLEEIARFKGVSPTKKLQVHGNIQLAQILHQADLVELYRFLIAPVTAGPRIGIFNEGGPSYNMHVVQGAVKTNGVFDVEMTPAGFEGGKTVSIEDGKEVLVEVDRQALLRACEATFRYRKEHS